MILAKLFYTGATNSKYINSKAYTVLGWVYNTGASAVFRGQDGEFHTELIEGNPDWALDDIAQVYQGQILKEVTF